MVNMVVDLFIPICDTSEYILYIYEREVLHQNRGENLDALSGAKSVSSRQKVYLILMLFIVSLPSAYARRPNKGVQSL